MKSWLPDANILLALTVAAHPDHARASRWLAGIVTSGDRFATCPITEGSLIRLCAHYLKDYRPTSGQRIFGKLAAHPAHISWLENFPYSEIDLCHLRGHRQITDAWLVELARRGGGMVATLDVPLATLYPDAAFCIPVF